MSSNDQALAVDAELLSSDGSGIAKLVPVPFIAVLGLVLCLIFGVTLLKGQSSSGAAGTGAPSPYAKQIIPADYLAIEQSDSVKKQCPGLSWTVVSAITHLESDDGRNAGRSSAGALGPNQFKPTTWDHQGRLQVPVTPNGEDPSGAAVDGNGDGVADITNPADSIPAAAHYLCQLGAGDPQDTTRCKQQQQPCSIYGYNHAWWYVNGGISDGGQPFEGILPLAAQLAVKTPVGGSIGQTGWPFAGNVAVHVFQCFGPQSPSGKHPGVDLDAPQGTPIYAMTTGTVTWAGPLGDYGSNFVAIAPDPSNPAGNYGTSYGHMDSKAVAVGQHVTVGQEIGTEGSQGKSTGPHLHFNVFPGAYSGHDAPNVDPMPFLKLSQATTNDSNCS